MTFKCQVNIKLKIQILNKKHEKTFFKSKKNIFSILFISTTLSFIFRGIAKSNTPILVFPFLLDFIFILLPIISSFLEENKK